MECTQFSGRLEALLDGTLADGDQTGVEAHAAACPRCRELYALMCRELESPSIETPSGLTESILARTSGRACGRAQTLLGDLVDGRLQGLDRELVDAHLQQCGECSALARVLIRLGEDLPVFAELRPDAALLGDVLARTVRPARWSAMWDRGLAAGRRLFERPRIAGRSPLSRRWSSGWCSAPHGLRCVPRRCKHWPLSSRVRPNLRAPARWRRLTDVSPP